MTKLFSLGKNQRLKSRKQIEQLFQSGKSFSIYPYKVFFDWVPNEKAVEGVSALQFGVGAGTRNFKKAVDRNRIKRLTREAFRLQKNGLVEKLEKNNRQLNVFFIYIGKEIPDFELVKEKTATILNKLTMMTDENSVANT